MSAQKSPSKEGRFSGVIQVTRSGKGFLIQEGTDDVEIFPENLGGALNGDIVEVALQKRGGRPRGRVVRVLERKTCTFVGELKRGKNGVILKPDDTRVYFDFAIIESAGAPVGHKVVVDVVSWDEPLPSAKVSEVLGEAGNHETEMRAIIASRGFSSDFPNAVVKEAEALYERAWDEEEIKKREDFRGVLTATIDPDDAKDFDDAISLKELENGNIEVGVHIADVSYFVTPKSLIEKEAFKRGTSVYLVDRTIPMLPPQLSEDLCSLKPEVDRLTFSAVFEINEENNVVGRRFTRGIINSNKRFTYDEADAALKDSTLPYHREINRLWALASKLRDDRKKDGAIMFDSVEIKPVLNEQKEVVDFKKIFNTESHQLIEELMLLANREVAEFVSKRLGKKNQLFVYRIHDKPNQERLEELSVFLRAIGYNLAMSKKGVSIKDLNRLFEEIKGTPEEHLIKTATIRSMAKAVYATKNIGHFGLSFDDYTHFTSPIRRYPDLMVHRTLAVLISGGRVTSDPNVEAQRAVHASQREASAVEAERASIKLKQVEYFAKLIGQKREGVVAGVTDWGIYIRDDKTDAEGMARLSTLTDDTYVYEQKKFAAIGQNSGNSIRLGDPISFTVEKVDLDERTIDFRIVKG